MPTDDSPAPRGPFHANWGPLDAPILGRDERLALVPCWRTDEHGVVTGIAYPVGLVEHRAMAWRRRSAWTIGKVEPRRGAGPACGRGVRQTGRRCRGSCDEAAGRSQGSYRHSPAPVLNPPPFQAKVVGITDGDTLAVLADRTPIKIRLHRIDAPEASQDPRAQQPAARRENRRSGEPALPSTRATPTGMAGRWPTSFCRTARTSARRWSDAGWPGGTESTPRAMPSSSDLRLRPVRRDEVCGPTRRRPRLGLAERCRGANRRSLGQPAVASVSRSDLPRGGRHEG